MYQPFIDVAPKEILRNEISSFFRVDEFNKKDFKRKIEKAKTCRELIQVLKVRLSLVNIFITQIKFTVSP